MEQQLQLKVHINLIVSKAWCIQESTMQDNEGDFWGFCRTILTLNEGQCRTIKKKAIKNKGEYGVPVHTPTKKQK